MPSRVRPKTTNEKTCSCVCVRVFLRACCLITIASTRALVPSVRLHPLHFVRSHFACNLLNFLFPCSRKRKRIQILLLVDSASAASQSSHAHTHKSSAAFRRRPQLCEPKTRYPAVRLCFACNQLHPAISATTIIIIICVIISRIGQRLGARKSFCVSIRNGETFRQHDAHHAVTGGDNSHSHSNDHFQR